MASNETAAFEFNPTPSIRAVPVGPGNLCVVIDEALRDPDGLVEWAAAQSFAAPSSYPYPGVVLAAPAALTRQVADCFALHARSRLGARRTLDATVRLSLVCTPPGELAPIQWQCHRDRIAEDPRRTLFAASVLYLYRNPALGGTSFYLPRQPPEQTERLVADSHVLDAAAFGARYRLQAGYMHGSNAYFERVARVGAAWNRMICYDGGQFHSADVDTAEALSTDPRSGRLTLNGFYTCRRNAG